jgi:FtsZ-binding cell division protein ZapB
MEYNPEFDQLENEFSDLELKVENLEKRLQKLETENEKLTEILVIFLGIEGVKKLSEFIKLRKEGLSDKETIDFLNAEINEIKAKEKNNV